ncbi:hypothetical protein KS4_04710 [Poriferisphaera corsica]|uniref:Uncharacterized protein n=1 Tax=Poriferisphaera corsica TaxID=2528020 RepID=A0A517YQD6_9BACT|nr:hypothetical protein KS4_04710 [Poriferisphaera corsica]
MGGWIDVRNCFLVCAQWLCKRRVCARIWRDLGLWIDVTICKEIRCDLWVNAGCEDFNMADLGSLWVKNREVC